MTVIAGAKNEGGKKLIIVGLTDNDIEALRSKHPILIKGEDLKMDTNVIVVHGENQAVLYNSISPHINEESNVYQIDSEGNKHPQRPDIGG